MDYAQLYANFQTHDDQLDKQSTRITIITPYHAPSTISLLLPKMVNKTELSTPSRPLMGNLSILQAFTLYWKSYAVHLYGLRGFKKVLRHVGVAYKFEYGMWIVMTVA